MSFAWDRLPSTPKDDPLQESVVAFSRDTSPTKVNLLMGVFCGPNGKPWVLPTVKKVFNMMSRMAGTFKANDCIMDRWLNSAWTTKLKTTRMVQF